MSFPKANIKRFNDVLGCAPPVGSYDPKLTAKQAGGIIDKSERFRPPKDAGGEMLDTPSKKRNPSDSMWSNTSVMDTSIMKSKAKKPEPIPTAELMKIKELEKEIRVLLQERTNQDKQLCQREDEITKLEGRLNNAQTDRSSLMAKVASLEKAIKDANKSNDLLKTKVTTAENSGKKNEALQSELSNLRHQLEVKDREIHRLRQELDNLIKTQFSDFTMFESIMASLEKKAADLQVNGLTMNGTTKTEAKTSKTEAETPSNGKSSTSKKSAEKLRRRFEEAIQSYSSKVEALRCSMEERCSLARQQQEDLETALIKAQGEVLQLSREMQADRDKSKDQRRQLYSKIRGLTDKNWTKEDEIRYLKGEVVAASGQAGELDQEAFELEAEVAALIEKMELLEEEKNTLNENIRILMEKFQILEKNHGQEKKSSRDAIENLRVQLELSQTSLRDIQQKYTSLEAKNNELIRNMHDQMEEVEALSCQIKEKDKECGNLSELIKEKENSITDLDVQLVGARIEMQHLRESAQSHKEEVQTLKREIQEVEESLRKQLKEEEETHQRTARGHADQIIDLEKKEICLLEENGKLKKEIQEATQQCTDMKNAVDRLEADLVNVRKQSDEEVKQLCEMKDKDMKELQENLQQAKAEIESLQKVVSEREDHLLNHQATVSNLEEKEAILRANVDTLEREYTEFKLNQESAMECVIQKGEEMREENGKLRVELESVVKEKHELFCKVAELQVSITETQSSLAEKEKRIINLSAENGDMDEKLKVISAEKEKLDVAVSELNQKLKETEEDIMKEKSLLAETESALKTKLEELQQEVEKNKDAFIKKEKDITSLMVENGQLMKEIDYLSSSRQQDQALMSEDLRSFEERVKQLIEEKASLYQKTADIASEKEKLEVENLKLKNESEHAVDELERVKAAVVEKEESVTARLTQVMEQKDSYEQVITSLSQQVRELQETNEKLEKDCENLTNSAHSSQAELESRTQALQAKLSSVMEENSGLTDQMGQAEQIKCKLKSEVEDLKVKIERLNQSHDSEIRKLTDSIQELKKSLHISTNSNQRELQQLQCELSNVVKKKMEDNVMFTEKISKAKSELQSERQIRQTLEEDFNTLQGKCASLEAARLTLTKTVDRLEGERDQLNSQNLNLGELVSQREADQQSLKTELQTLQSALRDLEIRSQEERERHVLELEAVRESIQSQARQEELDLMTAEAEKWQKLFEDLQAKVEPFMEQLDAFELEKQALLGRSNHAQAEMDKLANQYAKLLGHQNQKQKIHHVAKIKEENINLKKEVTLLREQITKQKRTIQKLEDKAGNDGRKRFDPSQAFRHSKENLAPPSSPLRDDSAWSIQTIESSDVMSEASTRRKVCHTCGKRKLTKGNRK
ncbi:uncharacterized protein LOC111125101 isoform X1 [Crassostrea virginica]